MKIEQFEASHPKEVGSTWNGKPIYGFKNGVRVAGFAEHLTFELGGPTSPEVWCLHIDDAVNQTVTPTPTIQQVPSQNYYDGWQGFVPSAIVIHTMSGSLTQTDNWFRDPTNTDSSSHYGVGLTGLTHQYVSLNNAAWGNGVLEAGYTWNGLPGVNPNFQTVSIETEDLGNPAQIVTDAQFASVLAVCKLVIARFSSIRTLATHRCISPQSRAHCPGDRWVASGRFAALASQLNLRQLL